MAATEVVSGADVNLMQEMAAGGLLREDHILARVPQWTALETAGVLPAGAASKLRSMHGATMPERTQMVVKDPQMTETLLRVIRAPESSHPAVRDAQQYILAMFHEVVRDDTYTLEGMLRALSASPRWPEDFVACSRSSSDIYCRGKAAWIASALMARAPYGVFDGQPILTLLQDVACRKVDMGQYAALDFVKNLLKQPALHESIWGLPQVPEMILSALDPKYSLVVYLALFCSWLITSNSATIANDFVKRGGVDKLCSILKNSKTEKLIRVAVRAVSNLLDIEEALEVIIQEDIAQTLTLLAYENWRDPEMFNELRETQTMLNARVKNFSSFDRYMRELEKGKLRNSLLHSEKFWRDNVMHFEDNEFAAVRKLSLLLRSEDPETLAVACHDLGEFAYMHPTGKKILQKLKTKEQILVLMNHRDRRVALEALLCLQKLMIERWREVATTDSKRG